MPEMRAFPVLFLFVGAVSLAPAQLIQVVDVKNGLHVTHSAGIGRGADTLTRTMDSPNLLAEELTVARGFADGRGGGVRTNSVAFSGSFLESASSRSFASYAVDIRSLRDEDGNLFGFLDYEAVVTATSQITVKLTKRSVANWSFSSERFFFGSVTSRATFRNEQTGFTDVYDGVEGVRNGRSIVDPGLYTITTSTSITDRNTIVGTIAGSTQVDATMSFTEFAGAPVPEPATLAALGLGAAALLRRRRAR